jgi:6-pyruvoyltetrahydropterin/6-carboxytetrahydropterin synthase
MRTSRRAEHVSFTIFKSFRFEAAHRLDGLPEGHQCGREHGHSYRVTLEIRSEGLVDPGFVQDFGDLKPFKRIIDEEFDHRNLNAVLGDPDGGEQPTSENLARYLYNVAIGCLSLRLGAVLAAVKVSETETSCAEYRP